MQTEYSAAIILFRRDGSGAPLYLLLHYPPRHQHDEDRGGHWDVPKGHIEDGENAEQAARREASEETGITDIAFREGFREQNHYLYTRDDGELMKKFVTYLVAETESTEVTLSHEHDDYAWLPYNEARERVTFENARAMLDAGHTYITAG